MIPAPDAFRCESRHPDDSLVRCFKTRDHDGPHQHERPSPSPTYHATTVIQWRDHPRLSEFPEGPYVDDDGAPSLHDSGATAPT